MTNVGVTPLFVIAGQTRNPGLGDGDCRRVWQQLGGRVGRTSYRVAVADRRKCGANVYGTVYNGDGTGALSHTSGGICAAFAVADAGVDFAAGAAVQPKGFDSGEVSHSAPL